MFALSPLWKWLVTALLVFHAGMLAWSAASHSPTLNEPAHLAAGLSHWQYGRFELYRVNPPLVRMVAALPVRAVGAQTNWDQVTDVPGHRPTFEVGRDFVTANGPRTLWLTTYARWACLPFSLLGAWMCGCWAREAFGPRAGVTAVALWCFSPNMLAHGSLLTPDAAAAAFAVTAAYLFWRWMRCRSWSRAIVAGVALGLAQLTKTSLLILLPVWPLYYLVIVWRQGTSGRQLVREASMLVVQLVVALYVLNAGYGFDGTGQRLGDFEFVSKLLTGRAAPDDADVVTGNRYRDGVWGALPMPFPRQYLLGIDVQRRDFEAFGRPSYLRGRFQDHGWWYYYLYAMGIKVPLGTWGLILLTAYARVALGRPQAATSSKDTGGGGPQGDGLLWGLPLLLLLLVSSQTGFSHHFRYALPALPFLFIGISQTAEHVRSAPVGFGRLALSCGVLSVVSTLFCFPHELSYFNELVGGPLRGHAHLINSNIDWGQDLWKLKRQRAAEPDPRPLRLAYYGYLDAAALGLEFRLPPRRSELQGTGPGDGSGNLPPGRYAVSVNFLRGYPFAAGTGTGQMATVDVDDFSYFLERDPVAYAGYSLYIYDVPER